MKPYAVLLSALFVAFLIAALFVTVGHSASNFTQVSWTPPTQYSDGKPIAAAPMQYRVYTGTKVFATNASATIIPNSELKIGRNCFQITATVTQPLSLESDRSVEGCKVIKIAAPTDGKIERPTDGAIEYPNR